MELRSTRFLIKNSVEPVFKGELVLRRISDDSSAGHSDSCGGWTVFAESTSELREIADLIDQHDTKEK